jgi:hypothetical protein
VRPFEASLREAPQDEAFSLMPSTTNPLAEERAGAAGAHLEGRTAPDAALYCPASGSLPLIVVMRPAPFREGAHAFRSVFAVAHRSEAGRKNFPLERPAHWMTLLAMCRSFGILPSNRQRGDSSSPQLLVKMMRLIDHVAPVM